ncbi:3-phosphoshikimate 1-carboxyvinyltransferase [Buchnera aphidicola]|uniref:3-phosphoshikimate 1-carboxyvinyltransferase n=1 Tax=Buchnera aphidicola TaxID=9 RepID=UPI00223859CA|nr:3-phosphoshikimate 1-carboxyvinyltransferase [Buchnera aphidicola]MCW5197711.1 3-phosphoshikimate 1-carboxyvinyltransferase [Buchnera aphidicola (Chaitophorus viminalis)]
MIKKIIIQPPIKIEGDIYLPGSKSITNRALLLSAMSYGKTVLKNILYSDDVKYMLYALQKLGIKYILSKNNTFCKIYGQGKNFPINKNITLFLGNAGTAVRSLLSVLSIKSNNIIITGDKRMQQRPIKHLIDALKQGNAKFKYLKQKNNVPIYIKGGFKGGIIFLNGSISSQFLTGLLLASPILKNNTQILIQGNLVSKPYIDLTIQMMKDFGIKVINRNYKEFFITGNQNYISPKKYFIEGDASSASYFLSAAAIKGGTVNVLGIGKNSIQGDIKFASILEKMGAKITFGKNYIQCSKKELHSIDMDLNDIPDAAMTIAITALFAKGKTTIRNIYNWRVKETDRLYAMSHELKKVGAIITEGNDYLTIIPPKKIPKVEISTYNDHRIAMCFSLLSLSGTPVIILNPKCINKTFPDYFLKFYSICKYN